MLEIRTNEADNSAKIIVIGVGASEISGWQANPPSETRRREAYGKLRRVRKAVEELPRKVSNVKYIWPVPKMDTHG